MNVIIDNSKVKDCMKCGIKLSEAKLLNFVTSRLVEVRQLKILFRGVNITVSVDHSHRISLSYNNVH